MAKAKKLPSGNWRVLVYIGNDRNGKRQYKSSTESTKKEAEYAAAEYVLNRRRENQAENLSFQKASDRYIESKSNLLSPATLRGYRIMQRNAYPLLLDQPIGKLAVNDLIQRQMNENAAIYSAKSLKNQFGFITAVMRYFKYNIDSKDVTLKPPEDHSIPVPTKRDVELIVKILQQTPEIECQALLALTCSLRQSEIAAITPFDVNGRVVRVHGARVPDETNKLVYKETNKSKAGTRNVIMPDYLAAKMARRCLKVKEGWLFDTTPGQVLYRFKKLLKSNKMPLYTIHSLRHCFAAIMHAQHVPDKYVMEMGGWSSDNVLKKVYQYTFEEEAAEAKKEANNYFDSLLKK